MKKFLSLFLSLLMVFSLLPVSALADDAVIAEEPTEALEEVLPAEEPAEEALPEEPAEPAEEPAAPEETPAEEPAEAPAEEALPEAPAEEVIPEEPPAEEPEEADFGLELLSDGRAKVTTWKAFESALCAADVTDIIVCGNIVSPKDVWIQVNFKNIVIAEGASFTVSAGANLTVHAGAELTVEAGAFLYNDGQLDIWGSMQVSGKFTNSGNLLMEPEAMVNVKGKYVGGANAFVFALVTHDDEGNILPLPTFTGIPKSEIILEGNYYLKKDTDDVEWLKELVGVLRMEDGSYRERNVWIHSYYEEAFTLTVSEDLQIPADVNLGFEGEMNLTVNANLIVDGNLNLYLYGAVTVPDGAYLECGRLYYYEGSVEWYYTGENIVNRNDPESEPEGYFGEGCLWEYDEATKTITVSTLYGSGFMPYDFEWVTPWGLYANEAEHVVIGEGVENVGPYAFEDFDMLKTVEIVSATEIGDRAFCDCDGLQYVSIPATVRNIWWGAFYDIGHNYACNANTPLVLDFGHGASDPLYIEYDAFYNAYASEYVIIFVPDAKNVNPALADYGFEDSDILTTFLDAGSTPITMERDYLLLEAGREGVVALATDGSKLLTTLLKSDAVTWEVTDENGYACPKNEAAVIVKPDGYGRADVIAKDDVTGQAYVKASVTLGGRTYSAFCRVDVLPKREPVEAHILTAAANLEVYKEGVGGEFRLMLNTPWTENTLLSAQNGYEIAYAEFTDPDLAEKVDLTPDGGRTVLMQNMYLFDDEASAALVGKSFTSAVKVTLTNGDEITTDNAITVNFKGTLPKVTVKAVSVNTFYDLPDVEYTADFSVPVTAVEAAVGKYVAAEEADYDPNPKTLTLKLTAAGAAYTKSKAVKEKLTVNVRPEGYWKYVPVAVSVSAKYTVPALKLAKASVTVPAYRWAVNSIPLTVLCKNKNDTMGGLGLTGKPFVDNGAGDTDFYVCGYPTFFDDFTYCEIDLSANDGGRELFTFTKEILHIAVEGSTRTVDLPFTVKIAARMTAKLTASTLCLNSADPNANAVTYVTVPAISGLSLDSLSLNNGCTVTVSRGAVPVENERTSEEEPVFVSNEIACGFGEAEAAGTGSRIPLFIEAGSGLVPGADYKVTVSSELLAKPLILTVKATPENAEYSVTLKKTGTLDLSNIMQFSTNPFLITVTPTLKNFSSYSNVEFAVLRMDKVTGDAEPCDSFVVMPEEDGSYHILPIDFYNIDAVNYKYIFGIVYTVENGTPEPSEVIATIDLGAKSASLKAKATSLTVDRDKSDWITASVTWSSKQYAFTEMGMEPEVSMQILDASGNDVTDELLPEGWDCAPICKQVKVTYDTPMGKETDNADAIVGYDFWMRLNNEALQYGAVYTVKYQFGANQTATGKISVMLPTHNTIYYSTPKVSGSLDSIRLGKTAAVKFTLKNAAQNCDISSWASVHDSSWTYYSVICEPTVNAKGAFTGFTVKMDPSNPLPAGTYVLQPGLGIYNAIEDTFYDYELPELKLTVKAGTAKFVANRSTVSLAANDAHDAAMFTVKSTDGTVVPVEKLVCTNSKFVVRNLDDGQFSVAWADGVTPVPGNVKLKLNVFCQGNTSAKANGTVTLTVTTVK